MLPIVLLKERWKMKITIKWVDLLDQIIKVGFWSLLIFNLWLERIDYAMVYVIVIIAYGISDIATNTKVKNNE